MKNIKWLRKIGLGGITAVVIIAGAAAFSAFEAHIVNVTARIENALSVSEGPLEFGTVFPQEYLTRDIQVELSDSFQGENRVDDVEYVIKQKPKVKGGWVCGETSQVAGDVPLEGCDSNMNPFPGDPYSSLDIEGFEGPAWEYCEDNLPLNSPYGAYNPLDEYWRYCYLPLANYLSKHETTEDGSETDNDKSVEAFHESYFWEDVSILNPGFIAVGRLAKSAQDIADNWTIDLKVPCFVNHCAQEADDEGNDLDDDTPGFHVPEEFRLPSEVEHLVFGTDLWIEVTGISLTEIGCEEQIDLMLVLDRSGSIDAGELTTLKNAANAFATALAPTGVGVHVGQSSFSSTGTLDLHLTGTEADVHTAINALTSGGLTNLFEGLDLANAELNNGHEHERPAVKDIIVVITDGNPNQPTNEATAKAAAAAEADAARLAGVEIFVVGVGGDVDATFLQTDIADNAAHYFAATDFDDLQAILVGLTVCPE